MIMLECYEKKEWELVGINDLQEPGEGERGLNDKSSTKEERIRMMDAEAGGKDTMIKPEAVKEQKKLTAMKLVSKSAGLKQILRTVSLP